MKLLLAVIQPTKLHAVQQALSAIGVDSLTVCDAQGYGRQKGQTATYRGVEYKVQMLWKISLEIWVNDDFVERVVETVSNVARTGTTGNIGDGKIFVLPTAEVFTDETILRRSAPA